MLRVQEVKGGAFVSADHQTDETSGVKTLLWSAKTDGSMQNIQLNYCNCVQPVILIKQYYVYLKAIKYTF